MKLATAQQMRELDQKAILTRRIPSIDLMERAAQGVCAAASELLGRGGHVSVLCGPGNNGGDGIAAARLLFLSGVKVRAFLAGSYEKLTPDALEMTGRLSECGVELEPFDPESDSQRQWILTSRVLVDALFGVGLSRDIDPASPAGVAAAWMNESRGAVVAADIASGVDADTGRIRGVAVEADRTVTFTLPKIGQFVGEGAVFSGQVTVWDIGIPPLLVREVLSRVHTVESDFVREALPPRRADGHKGTFGKVLLLGGSVGFSGAPYLAALGAARSGCGLVYLGVPESLWAAEAGRCVCTMPFPLPEKKGMLGYRALEPIEEKLAACDVLALGPGLGRGEQTARLVRELLARTEKPVVLDADGINALEAHIDVLDARQGRVTILTPHGGEFARLGGEVSGGRAQAAQAFAQSHGCTLVLKGHRTVTATPSGVVQVNTTGGSGMAKGGSGDVLTGVIASLLAQGATPLRAAAAGVWLHGRAGDLASQAKTAYGMTPEDLADFLPEAFRWLRDEA
jgi:NAD(P)H-hydrate epimerase